MTQEDILRMAREAGLALAYSERDDDDGWNELARFAALAAVHTLSNIDPSKFMSHQEGFEAGAAAQREKLAHWMRSMGYATGHGDTIEDLLDHLGTQISEGLEVEVLMEREACAKVCESMPWISGQTLPSNVEMAAAIRARSKK